MSKVRNPNLIPTNTLAVGFNASSINVGKAITVEFGVSLTELNFTFAQATTERPVTWDFVNEANKTAEYAILTVDSSTWAAGTLQAAFIIPGDPVIGQPFGVNLDLVDSISKNDKVDYIGGATIYQIFFTYEAIGFGPKTIEWNFALESDRDTVLGELTNNVAALTYL